MDKIGSTYRTPPEDDERPENTQASYRRSRRRRTTPYRYQADAYYPDEHPEIPKIRRASLQLDAQHGEKASQQQGKKPAPTNYALNNRQRSSLKDHLQGFSHSRALLIVGTLVILILTPIMITSAIFITHPSSTSGTSNLRTPAKGTAVPVNQRPADPHQIVIIPSDTDHPPPPVFAQSAYLMDADTGVTLYAYNPFKHIPMLSTTKLMTAVIALDIGNPAQKITITDAIAHDVSLLSPDSSLFGVKKGETYTLSDLLYGLLLMSGNDAAVVIADGLSGNIQNFVAKMNQKALQLGMYDTHYMNPHGLLQPGHYSSAHDLAVIGRYSMSIPLIHQITGTRVYHLPPGNHPDRILINGDQFLWWYPGVDGGKPGWDAATNFLQVISCTRNHHHLIGVVMHSNNFWTDMRDLLNWGFDNFTWISPHDVDFQHPIPYDSDSNYFARDKKENTIPTADKGRYYIYTGFSISGPIMAYFDQGGGLKKFGYPISLPSLSSTQVISQRFEHAAIQCSLLSKQCTTT
jgi:D-alanyl-D-alanine carboxypeptidase